MTKEDFEALPIGTKIKVGDLILEKHFDGTYQNEYSIITFSENGYVHKIGDLIGRGYVRNVVNEITIMSIPNSQPIESLLSEKKELEEKIKNIDEKISAHKETVLNNLVPGEWYKIQTDYSSGYFVRKFVKYVDRGDGEIYLITKYQSGQDDSLQKKKIKSIIHIPGAKEAEENFLNMLKG